MTEASVAPAAQMPEVARRLNLRPIDEIDGSEISGALARSRPFVVRGWVKPSHGWGLDDPKWAQHTGQVTLVPPSDRTVSSASYKLRKSGMTREMSFRELFDRIMGKGEWQPLIDPDERYYLFGGKVPRGLLNALPWPEDLEFVGSSPYVASEGVTGKAHYDHWYAFLVQLHGAKAVKMFPPWDYGFIYPELEKRADTPRRALVNLDTPDFERFPLLKHLRGEVTVLNAGDLLYMPVHWWHEVETTGFSVSINRRLRRSAREWSGALAVFGYAVLEGVYRHGVERIPSKEVKDLAEYAHEEWTSETGGTKYEDFCAYIAQSGSEQAKALQLPKGVGTLMARWLLTGRDPSREEFDALSRAAQAGDGEV